MRLAALAEELAERLPQPVDELEVAAVLESIGITDEVALQDFGEPDVFALAEQLFPIVRVISRRTKGEEGAEDAGRLRGPEGRAISRAVTMLMLALGPVAVLGLIQWALSRGGWDATDTALVWGMSAGMLLAAGPTFAVGRRSAILAGFGYLDRQRLYLRRRALWSVALLVVAVGVFAVVAEAVGASVGVVKASAIGAGGLGTTWILVNILLFAGRTTWVLGCLAAAFGVGGGVTGTASPLVGLYAGAIAAVVLLTAATLLLARGLPRHPRGARGALLAVESMPYAFYALLAIAFMIAPSALAWLGEEGAASRAETAGEVGLAFTVAIIPIAVSVIFIEPSMRTFWDLLRISGAQQDQTRFRATVRGFLAARILRYAVLHGALSLAFALLFLLLALNTDVDEALAGRYVLAGLAFYWLLGCTQYTALLLLNLSQPLRAAAPFAAGLGIALGASIAAVLLGLPYAIPIVATGAAAAGLAVALRNWKVVMNEIAYVYSTAF